MIQFSFDESTYLLYVGIIKVDPNSQLCMIKERRIVLAIVGDDTDQLVGVTFSPLRIRNLVENVRQAE